MSMFVRLSVCEHITETTSNLHPKSSCMIVHGMARSSYGGVVIRNVLPVLWITSYLLIVGHVNIAAATNVTVSSCAS